MDTYDMRRGLAAESVLCAMNGFMTVVMGIERNAQDGSKQCQAD